MKIDILGTGCPKCAALFENARRAIGELQIDADVAKVEDIQEITNYGVMLTPALAIDGEVKSTGRLLSVEEIKGLLA